MFWRNIIRVAEGLALCHDAGIVHGAVSEQAIFSHADDKEDFRLVATKRACISPMVIWPVAGRLAATVWHRLVSAGLERSWPRGGTHLGPNGGGRRSSLLSIERRMLDRLANPPHYQLFDGSIVLSELAEVVADLDRVRIKRRGRTCSLSFLSSHSERFSALTSGTVLADDKEARASICRRGSARTRCPAVVVDSSRCAHRYRSRHLRCENCR